jgi:LmbE family N-acetylglucosaminyl deacetylase
MRDAGRGSRIPASRVPRPAMSSPERSLLFVFAHPDDETFATGGTIARYAAEGVACHLYCATEGGAGKSSGIPVDSPAALGRLRREELERAARILGLATMRVSRHADGALGAVDADLLVGEIVEVLRDTRPQVVVTFGPEGAPTAHRDHRAISRAATAAWFLAGNPFAYADQLAGGRQPWTPARLLYLTWKAPADGAIVRTQGLPADAVVDVEAHLPRKREAFLAHATQRQHEGNFTALAMHRSEGYALAAGRPFPTRADGRAARDLFDGLGEG